MRRKAPTKTCFCGWHLGDADAVVDDALQAKAKHTGCCDGGDNIPVDGEVDSAWQGMFMGHTSLHDGPLSPMVNHTQGSNGAVWNIALRVEGGGTRPKHRRTLPLIMGRNSSSNLTADL
jgi:hypothetical protein